MEDVDDDALALELVEEELRCGGRGEVERNGCGRDAVSLQIGGELRELVGAARD